MSKDKALGKVLDFDITRATQGRGMTWVTGEQRQADVDGGNRTRSRVAVSQTNMGHPQLCWWFLKQKSAFYP